MRSKIATVLAALAVILGLGVAAPSTAQASTGYKSAYCFSAAGDKLTVTSWINDTGTKTWHYSATTGYFNNVYQTVTGTHIYSATGYLTNAKTSNYIWKAYWKHGVTYYACNLTV